METVRTAARAVARVLRRAANRIDDAAKTQLWVMKHPRRDMVEEADETYYGAQYLHWLAPLVAELPSGGRVVDLGCGHGRLALEIAARRPDCAVVGVDHSPPSIAGAKAHAARRGLGNCRFQEQGISDFLSGEMDSSVDLLLYVEVSFFASRELGVLPQCARVLRPAGHLFAAFRSQWFNLLHSVAAGDLESALLVRDARDGRLWGGGHRFWWHTLADIRREFAEAGLAVAGPCRGIGAFSALRDDGLGLRQPASLDDRRRALLLELELALAEEYASQGRYIVGIGRK